MQRIRSHLEVHCVRSKSIVLVLLIVFSSGLVVTPFLAVKAAGSYKDIDWNITGAMTYSSEYVDCTSNITINNGSSLTLKKSTLTFLPVDPIPYYFIHIMSEGTLIIEDSTLTTSEPYLVFMIICEGTLEIKGSSISHLASYEFDSEYVGGIIVLSDKVSISDTTIYNSEVGISLLDCNAIDIKDTAINGTFVCMFSKRSSVTISGISLSDSVYGIYDVDSKNEYRGNALNNLGEAFHLEMSSSEINSNEVQGSDYGITSYLSDNVTICNNHLFKNNIGLRAMGGYLDIQENKFEGGMDAIDLLAANANIINNDISGQRLIVTEAVDCSGCTKPEILGNGAGIYQFHSTSIIQDNRILDCNIGISSEISTGSIMNNEILNMSETGCQNHCANINEAVISLRPLVRMAGTGLLVMGQTDEALIVKGNTISNNDNDGVFLSDCLVTFGDNIVSGNGGYGIHTLECQLDDAVNNTIINNLAGYAHSIYVSFRTMDVYGDIMTYVNVEVKDLAGDLLYTDSSEDIAFLSVVLLSYTGDAPVPIASMSSFERYNISFSKSGVVKYETFTASPERSGAHNISIPLLRSDLTVTKVNLGKEVILGDEVEITATIMNTGDTKATNVTVLFIWNSDGESRVISSKTIPEIKPDQSKTVSVYWAPPTKGDYSITVESDPDNDINEISDGNNQRSVETTVKTDTNLWVMLTLEFIFMLVIFLVVYITTNKKF